MAYIASAGGGAAAAAAAAIAQAIKASGAIVRVEPEDFIRILARTSKPLVVIAKGGIFKPNYQYLTAYKGLFFFTKSDKELLLSGDNEIVAAKQIWIPG
jgi:hypothetical protein